MIRESPARTGYGFGRDGQAELCVLQCSLCKMSKIKCGGVIFTAVQSMRVGKMRLCQTKRAGAQIHLPDKRRLASGYRDRQRQSRIISGMEHHAVKQVPACQRLAIFQIHTGAFQSDGCVRHGHVFFQFARFADEKASHDLRCAGNQRTLIAVLRVKALSCHSVEQRGAFGRHLRRRCDLRGARHAHRTEEKGGGAECRFPDCFLNAAFHSASPC